MKSFTLGLGPTGIRRDFHIDEASGVMHTQDIQDGPSLQRLLDRNHERRRDGRNKQAVGVPIADVPLTLIMIWDQEYKAHAQHAMEWDEFLDRKLKHPDFSLLLTSEYGKNF